jgi:membrane protease YdiL (CAAX protease family)
MATLASACVTLFGCTTGIPRARLSRAEAPTPREIESRRVYREASCAASTGLFFPGLGQLCQRRFAEGAVVTSLGVAELGTAVGAGLATGVASHSSVTVPLLSLQNLWMAGYGNALFVEQQARHLRYVPQDTLAELVFAPFNPRVLSQLDVWLGLAVQLGAGVALSLAVSKDVGTSNAGGDANIFGHRFDPAVGYPLAGGLGAALFTHVAVGEETVFRGMIQSEMARRNGETEGWIAASMVFGVLHAPNALALDPDEQSDYLVYGVPFLMATGGYLGLVYRWHDYSLAPPVALHFWYDFLLSAVSFAINPDDSILSARVAVPF